VTINAERAQMGIFRGAIVLAPTVQGARERKRNASIFQARNNNQGNGKRKINFKKSQRKKGSRHFVGVYWA
jgi:hypothetical protein